MTLPQEHEVRLKRLVWRATHRGIKEMDIILGGFVTRNLAQLSADDISELETLMDVPDQQMLSWATRQEPLPPRHDTPLMARILGLKP